MSLVSKSASVGDILRIYTPHMGCRDQRKQRCVNRRGRPLCSERGYTWKGLMLEGAERLDSGEQ